MRSIYLAGPDVFYPNALQLGEAKKALCQAYGFVGHFPLDNVLDLSHMSPQQAGQAIFLANKQLMCDADLIIANMTPFRGAGMDGGTAFEMGFFSALDKPVYGYTLDTRDYCERVESALESTVDLIGDQIEAFALADNLMMAGAVMDQNCEVVRINGNPHLLADHLTAFEQILEMIAV